MKISLISVVGEKSEVALGDPKRENHLPVGVFEHARVQSEACSEVDQMRSVKDFAQIGKVPAAGFVEEIEIG